jgi:uncharacterized protein YbjQ (UPF0145 family)
MIKKISMVCVLLLFSCVSLASARDAIEKVSINEAFEFEQVKELFADDISFFWGDQVHPPVIKKFGSYKTSKRTSAFGKDRVYACSWAMASALNALRDRAVREGGNAVINIVSNINNNEESSTTEFTCLAGRMVVNVALKGTVVTLGK